MPCDFLSFVLRARSRNLQAQALESGNEILRSTVSLCPFYSAPSPFFFFFSSSLVCACSNSTSSMKKLRLVKSWRASFMSWSEVDHWLGDRMCDGIRIQNLWFPVWTSIHFCAFCPSVISIPRHLWPVFLFYTPVLPVTPTSLLIL